MQAESGEGQRVLAERAGAEPGAVGVGVGLGQVRSAAGSARRGGREIPCFVAGVWATFRTKGICFVGSDWNGLG